MTLLRHTKRDRLAFVARVIGPVDEAECRTIGAVDDKSRRSLFCVSQSDLRIRHPRLCHIIHKKVDVSIDRQSPHFGSIELTNAIKSCRPRNALCGHTGDHNPITLSHADGSATIVRNVLRLDEEYKVRYEPFIFEV